VARRYITVAEAAEYLLISGRTMRRLIHDGEVCCGSGTS
jgi:excisionase family DNA binding protein